MGNIGIKKTHEKFKEEVFNLVGDKYEVLGQYINAKTKIKIKHTICNHEFEKNPMIFLQGQRCPYCYGHKRITHDEFVNKVFEIVGNEYTVLGEYKNKRTKIKMKHNICNYEFEMKPCDFLNGHRCDFCFGCNKKTREEFVEDVFNIVGDEYIVLGEYITSTQNIRMKHKNCGNEFDMKPGNFLHGQRCPVCCKRPRQVVIGFNSMWDTKPELAKLLADPNDGYKYTSHSMVKLDWKCPECGNIVKNILINRVSQQSLVCHRCSDNVSYPNRLMFSLLDMLDIDFEVEKTFKWLKGRYDFYFVYNEKPYIVEMDGLWHFKDNNLSGRTKEESHQIDAKKDRLAEEHGIHMIRINCQKSELEYIKNNIFNSEISNIFNLSPISWEICNKRSISSLKIQVCKLWEEYHDLNIILNIMKRKKSTLILWLKQCTKVGICNYNPV